MSKTHPLVEAALRAYRGETSERFGVSVSEVAAMHHAVLAVLREMREYEPDGGHYTPDDTYSDMHEEWLRAIIREIEG